MVIGRRRMLRTFDRLADRLLAEFDWDTAAYKTPAQLEIEQIMARREREDAELAAAASDGEREAIMARQVRGYAECAEMQAPE